MRVTINSMKKMGHLLGLLFYIGAGISVVLFILRFISDIYRLFACQKTICLTVPMITPWYSNFPGYLVFLVVGSILFLLGNYVRK